MKKHNRTATYTRCVFLLLFCCSSAPRWPKEARWTQNNPKMVHQSSRTATYTRCVFCHFPAPEVAARWPLKLSQTSAKPQPNPPPSQTRSPRPNLYGEGVLVELAHKCLGGPSKSYVVHDSCLQMPTNF